MDRQPCRWQPRRAGRLQRFEWRESSPELYCVAVISSGSHSSTCDTCTQGANGLPGTYARFVTSEGNFTVRLFDQEAPRTVGNFVGLADGTKEWSDPRTNQKVQKPYYNGTIFHRVIDGFMIQGGDPLGQGIGGPGYNFADEFHPKLRHNKAGVLSMANRGPNTNGGQFFI